MIVRNTGVSTPPKAMLVILVALQKVEVAPAEADRVLDHAGRAAPSRG